MLHDFIRGIRGWSEPTLFGRRQEDVFPTNLFLGRMWRATPKSTVILMGLLLTIFCGNLASQESGGSGPQDQLVVPATDAIFAAFQTHSIIAIADSHGLAQEEDFYVDLIRDPRFAKEVGDVVVEFGGAAQQQTIDPYTAGEDIPYEQLRKVWTDTVGWNPTVVSLGYVAFFA